MSQIILESSFYGITRASGVHTIRVKLRS